MSELEPRTPDAPRLTGTGWQRLLAALDPDPVAAGRAYEALRARLIDTFRWKGLARADELADTAFDRAARRLAEGEQLERGLTAYVVGIARKLVLEGARADARIAKLPPELPPAPADAPDPQADACLETCLGEQPRGARDTLLRYLAGRGERAIADRKRQADDLGITANSLRIRVHRIRAAVEACLRACLADESPETSRPRGAPGS